MIDWSDLIDKSEKIATIIGLIFGGLWVYFNSFRGRIFIPRLQLELSGKLVQQGQLQYILATMQIKNVGTSIVQIKGRGTGLKISCLSADSRESGFQSLSIMQATAFPVLEKHTISENEETKVKRVKVIEPGTTINEQKLMAVPEGRYDAFQLELRVTAISGIRGRPDRAWRAIAIVANNGKSRRKSND